MNARVPEEACPFGRRPSGTLAFPAGGNNNLMDTKKTVKAKIGMLVFLYLVFFLCVVLLIFRELSA